MLPLLPVEEFSLTRRSKHLMTVLVHCLPRTPPSRTDLKICKGRLAEPGTASWLCLAELGGDVAVFFHRSDSGESPGLGPKNVAGIPGMASLKRGSLGQAEMSMILQMIHSWLLLLAPSSRKDFLSGSQAAKSSDLKRFLESFQK